MTTPVQTVRKPEEAKERHAAPQRTSQKIAAAPGEITCPVCGTGNPQGRRFCRRCGTTLATGSRPQAMAHPSAMPSEQQLRAAQRRFRRALVVQHRVGRATALGVGAFVLLYALAATLDVLGLGDWTRARVNGVLSGVPVTGLAASAEPDVALADLGPAHAVDPIAANTAWATSWAGPPTPQPDVPASCSLPETGAGGALVLRLPAPTPLSRIAIGAGLPPQDPERLGKWRPTAVHLHLSDGSCIPMRLNDSAEMQDVHVNVESAEWMRVAIVAAAPPQDGAGTDVAIHTVQLFSPRWR